MVLLLGFGGRGGGSEDKRKIYWKRWELLARPKGEGGLGFKDLGDFNQALVGRLTWRLIQYPRCLMAKVLKAKYFPHGSVLDFECKNHFSFLCKSLCWGRDLLGRGVRWQVGEGNLRAFSQPWIPRTGAFSVLTEDPGDGYPWRVAEFMKNGCWNRDIVEALFLPCDVEAILKIPLGERLSRDRLVWHLEEDGNYSVRSSYRLARSGISRGPSCSASEEPRWWKRLWSLRIPLKVKHLVWRVWFEALPTYGSLKKRGVACLPFCTFCEALPEDAPHAMWGCERAQAIWRSSTLQRWAEKIGAISFRELCLRALDGLSEKNLELFCGLI